MRDIQHGAVLVDHGKCITSEDLEVLHRTIREDIDFRHQSLSSLSYVDWDADRQGP
jgi:hypothetical protein